MMKMKNTNDWQVTRLSSRDAPLMRQLQGCFGRAFDDIETHVSKPPSEEYLSRLLSKDTCVALVVCVNEEVVGGLVAYQLEKFEQERSEVYLYDLAVDIAFRRQGIACALIKSLLTIAASLGAYEVFVQADYEDVPAVALYTGLGEREDVMHFSIAAP